MSKKANEVILRNAFSKDFRKKLNFPLEKYNFIFDFNDEFYSKEFPRMWKNVCLFVETHYWDELTKKVEEIVLKQLKWLINEIDRDDELIKYFYDTLWERIQDKVIEEKLKLARKMIQEQLEKLDKIKPESDKYILTKQEQAELEKSIKNQVNKIYTYTIDKNGLYIVIDLKAKETIFRLKDWTEWIINNRMSFRAKKDLDIRIQEILEMCWEAGLFYKWIAKIFNASERVIYNIMKEYWYEVFLSPQKDYKNLEKVKVLDDSWYFVIEKKNTKK